MRCSQNMRRLRGCRHSPTAVVQVEGKQKLVFECPSRGLIGFRAVFATLTRGSGIMHRAFSAYGPYRCNELHLQDTTIS